MSVKNTFPVEGVNMKAYMYTMQKVSPRCIFLYWSKRKELYTIATCAHFQILSFG